MKNKSIFLFIAQYLLCFCVNAQTDFIKIRGRQFFDNEGQPFYPMHAVYFLDVIYPSALAVGVAPRTNPVSDPDINQYYIAPNAWYGWPTMNGKYESYDETISLDLIEQDFRKIKEMGFNGVRLSNSSWRYNLQYKDWKNDVVRNFPQEFYLKTWPDQGPYSKDVVQLRRHYDQDPFLQRYLTLLDLVLERAERADIDVLLDVSVFGIYNFPGTVDDFDDLLNIYGNHFSSNKTLMGYVIIQEPAYTDLADHVKSDICEKVDEHFYFTIKRADPNHLVTIGMIDVQDVVEWDPAILKVDFLMPHVYPFWRNYEHLNMTDGIDRVLGKLYWISKNYPVPWFIGETNILASNTAIEPGQMQGTETQQKEFVDAFLEQVHNCSGSGFTYFAYQESGRNDGATGQVYNDGSGILNQGELDDFEDTNYDKEFVTSIRNYFVNRHAPNPDLCLKPYNYYDPYNAERYSNYFFPSFPGSAVTIPIVKGTVTDQYGNPIEDALVTVAAFSSERTHDDPIDPLLVTGVIENSYYTFTDEDGKYQIKPFSIKPDGIPLLQYQYIRWMKVTAPGCSIEQMNEWKWLSDPNDPTTVWDGDPPNVEDDFDNDGNINFNLTKNNSDYDIIIQNQAIANQNSQDFTGRLKLTAIVQNSILSGGNSTFIALDTVHIKDEFQAFAGCTLTIKNTTVFDDCIEFPSTLRYGSFNLHRNPKIKERNKEMELIFQHKEDELSIFPNPNTGIFQVGISDESELENEIQVFDTFGKQVFEITTSSKSMEFNFSSQPKGLYILRANDNKRTIYKRFIIQ
ncbi:MAG: T9SS type A sorting domain-containing protein [Bacteroidia bacterium]|nr:T9SS type A sorting domain-containing protein [Bacteroidia bacterium]